MIEVIWEADRLFMRINVIRKCVIIVPLVVEIYLLTHPQSVILKWDFQTCWGSWQAALYDSLILTENIF